VILHVGGYLYAKHWNDIQEFIGKIIVNIRLIPVSFRLIYILFKTQLYLK
jgi:hypothetical protein